MAGEFQISGQNPAALFTLKLHRGEGMTLLAMNWKVNQPPLDFVGFAIEYREPNGDKFFVLKNRLGFLGSEGDVNPNLLSTRLAPIQKFRWIHFPRNAELAGEFVYRVTPVFMNDRDELSYGESQDVAIELRRETYPDTLNVTFTRGFVSSQAFVDRYVTKTDGIKTLLPPKADDGLDFVPTHPQAKAALAWMGFEARSAIIEVLDRAIADNQAQVRVVAYDLSESGIVSRLEQLGDRLAIIIDDSKPHGELDSAETQAAERLRASAGDDHVQRQHMGQLQHNKTIVVDSPNWQTVVCGSTNFSWRGFFVQANNAVVLHGKNAIAPFLIAFEGYWQSEQPAKFGKTAAAEWADLKLSGIDAKVSFSPHSKENALLEDIAIDISQQTNSSLFYSLAFLSQTKGAIREAIEQISDQDQIFVYGIADKRAGGGLDLQKPNGNISPVFAAALTKNLPEPFKSEPSGGGGIRMHHKFIVIDFDQPTARVYLGSYNFSEPADTKNGENLLLIRDQRIAVAYVVEALRIFDHYHFRVAQQEATESKHKLYLAKPPRQPADMAWWADDYTVPIKIRDRLLFA
jgi:phosphatidylserine/phosphatidylglycerophosphate/cardiolipin synthase-like enzyme